jgi:hypothetical protein
MEYRAYKYCGGVYCGNGEFDSIDEAVKFANDGFCDYVRIVADDGMTLKVHITDTGKKAKVVDW